MIHLTSTPIGRRIQRAGGAGFGCAALISVAALIGCTTEEPEATTTTAASAAPAPPAEPAVTAATLAAAPFADALAKVNAQCPPSYPDVVTPLPEAGAFDAMPTAQLMDLLGSWSPAMRSAAAGALATRGDEVIPLLVEALDSDSPSTVAGAAGGLARLVSHQVRNWQQVMPDETDAAAAQAKVRSKHAALADQFIAMTTSPDREVRDAALGALITLQLDTPAVKHAILAMCDDPDEYIASNAMISFEKRFSVDNVDPDKLTTALEQTLRGPLPRARGHGFRLMNQLDEETQRQFIPLMLAHLDWQPDRDTMFGSGGQADAVKKLTRWRVKELVPRLPALMTKTMRGPGLFDHCIASVKAFGADSKVILPELKAYIAKLEADYETASSGRKPGIQARIMKLQEAVDYVEKL